MIVEELTHIHLRTLGRPVYLRPNTHDGFTHQDAEGLFHVPPKWMPTPETVLDLGANIGLIAPHYKEMWPQARVLCVEMDEGNCEMFTLNAPGFELIHSAVEDREGTWVYDSSEETNRYALGSGDTEVELVTIPQLAEELGGSIDCKMDIEGGEWRLFNVIDSWAPLVRNLLVELHSGGTWQSAWDQLRDANYRVNRSWIHPDALFAWR
jgi:FkbM family methyltransferase